MKERHAEITPSFPERRRHPRYLIKLPLEYRRIGDSKMRPANTVNFSEGGLMIAGHERMQTGVELEIKIYFATGLELFVIPAIAKVAWTETESSEKEWNHFGVNFIKIFPKDIERLKSILRDHADPSNRVLV